MTLTVFKKKIHSEIILSEVQKNKNRKGNEAEYYYPVYIRTKKKHVYALFTKAELKKAVQRALKNPEDRIYEPQDYWFYRLLKLILW